MLLYYIPFQNDTLMKIFLSKIGPEVQQKSSEILHLDATNTGWWFQPI